MESPNREMCALMNEPCLVDIKKNGDSNTAWNYLCRLARLGNKGQEEPINPHSEYWENFFEDNTPQSAAYVLATTKLLGLIPWHSCEKCAAKVCQILDGELETARPKKRPHQQW